MAANQSDRIPWPYTSGDDLVYSGGSVYATRGNLIERPHLVDSLTDGKARDRRHLVYNLSQHSIEQRPRRGIAEIGYTSWLVEEVRFQRWRVIGVRIGTRTFSLESLERMVRNSDRETD